MKLQNVQNLLQVCLLLFPFVLLVELLDSHFFEVNDWWHIERLLG